MMTSLFAAVSGLKSHQQRIDVIGNNIANVNTTAFKKSRVTFADVLSHTIRGASRPVEGGRGGINPMQVGPGVSVASIDTIFTGSSLEDTGKDTDLGISGEGFFVLSDGQQTLYTRAGNFDFDPEGNLVSLLNGMRVQGWSAKDGVLDTNAVPGNIKVPAQGVSVPAKATTTVDFSGNLNAGVNGSLAFDNGTGSIPFTVNVDGNDVALRLTVEATNSFNKYEWMVTAEDSGVEITGGSGEFTLGQDGDLDSVITGAITIDDGGGTPATVNLSINPDVDSGWPSFTVKDGTYDVVNKETTSFTPANTRVARQTVFDSLGHEYTLTTTFTRLGDREWDWESVVTKATTTGIIEIDTGDPNPNKGTIEFDERGRCRSAGDDITISFDPGNEAEEVKISPLFGDITQFASSSSVVVRNQDGYKDGSLQNYTFDNTGTIIGVFSNGTTQDLAKVALVNFANPAGLLNEGESMFSHSSNSGDPVTGESGVGGFGIFRPGSLETSNVDISSEFTNLIITQRGFQANSRVITTSDEMLQELVSLKR